MIFRTGRGRSAPPLSIAWSPCACSSCLIWTQDGVAGLVVPGQSIHIVREMTAYLCFSLGQKTQAHAISGQGGENANGESASIPGRVPAGWCGRPVGEFDLHTRPDDRSLRGPPGAARPADGGPAPSGPDPGKVPVPRLPRSGSPSSGRRRAPGQPARPEPWRRSPPDWAVPPGRGRPGLAARYPPLRSGAPGVIFRCLALPGIIALIRA